MNKQFFFERKNMIIRKLRGHQCGNFSIGDFDYAIKVAMFISCGIVLFIPQEDIIELHIIL